MKTLNIGLVGYGFMGRTHSNAFHQAPRFFDLPYRPVLKAVSARNEERVKKFAANWGYDLGLMVASAPLVEVTFEPGVR